MIHDGANLFCLIACAGGLSIRTLNFIISYWVAGTKPVSSATAFPGPPLPAWLIPKITGPRLLPFAADRSNHKDPGPPETAEGIF